MLQVKLERSVDCLKCFLIRHRDSLISAPALERGVFGRSSGEGGSKAVQELFTEAADMLGLPSLVTAGAARMRSVE
jgi:hypothetical protein